MDPLELASISANLEHNFYYAAEKDVGHEFQLTYSVPNSDGTYGEPQTHTFKVAAVMEYDTEQTMVNASGETVKVYGPKAIIFEDEQGNIYAHFNGTGDGKWGQNATNYGGPPSEVQTDSLEFFDKFMAENYEGRLNKGNVYTTGHSQGGNTAQYVTMKSQYGQYIDMCMDKDGPKFSHDAVQDFKGTYGEAYYEQQREKIYAVHGEIDFVSPLGQEEIVPEGHTYYVEQTNRHEGMFDMHNNPHSVAGMLGEHPQDVNGTFDGKSYSLNPLRPTDAPLRQFVTGFNNYFQERIPQDQQEEAAKLVMKIAESFLGNSENGDNLRDPLSPEELERVKELALPLLVEYIHKNPQQVEALVDDLVNRGMIDADAGVVIKNMITEFNKLPEDQRQDAVEALAKNLVVKEDGTLGVDPSLGSILATLVSLGPAIFKAAAQDPSSVGALLEKAGIMEAIKDLIGKHPIMATVVAVAVAALWKPLAVIAGGLAVFAIAVSTFVNLVYAVVEALQQFGEAVKNFVLNTLAAIRDFVQNAKEFLRSLTPGVKYAAQNPHFKANTDTMRICASRLASVNSRLVALDGSLNSLYWQVGMLDILDILALNITTHYSPRLLAAQTYLNSAATTLETAEATALGYIGG